MGSPPCSARSTGAASTRLVGLLFHHLRSAVDILEHIAREGSVGVAHSPGLPIQPSAAPANSSPTDKLSFTIKEVVSLLGVGRTTVYNAIAQKELKAVKLGSRTLILRDDLQSWMATFPAR
jgi:excisionase family DNA binding protein